MRLLIGVRFIMKKYVLHLRQVNIVFYPSNLLPSHEQSCRWLYFWSNSTTVIQWIRNNTRTYKTFAANRLGENDELTQVHEWRYIPTAVYVADFATRYTLDISLFNLEWLNGPRILNDDEQSWPLDPVSKNVKEKI